MNQPHESQQHQPPQHPLIPVSAYQRPPKPPPAPWQRRQHLGTWLIVCGAIAVIVAVVIEYGWYSAGTVSHLNGLCSSGLGQLAQAGSSAAASGCSQAALLDQVVGWGIILGLVAVVAGVAATVSARHLRAAGAPAGPATFPPPQG